MEVNIPKMKFMFHKKNLYGKWFSGEENDGEFTEKEPSCSKCVWDEENGEWVKPEGETNGNTAS